MNHCARGNLCQVELYVIDIPFMVKCMILKNVIRLDDIWRLKIVVPFDFILIREKIDDCQ